MRASHRWLRSLLPALEAEPEAIADRLTRSGLEVEELVEYGAASPCCRVAEVRRIEPHPERDRLSLVTVARGDGEQTVVCGAPNVPEPGGKVVLAPTGTHLPALGLTVEQRAIGGVESAGMLVSEVELGLVAGAGKGEGILVLEGDAPVGVPFSEAAGGVHDWIYDIGVTPNRPDALGHVGLARELSALYGLQLEMPEPPEPARLADGDVADRASVRIEDTERCPRYGAGVVVGVTVGPSPDWLRYRLESLGVRSLSNVVDVTNLLLLELGHPTHAFDLDALPGGAIVVRRARRDETIVTIDHVERRLSDDDLLITDGERPIALAGVMGGLDSEIGEGTTQLLLEVAHFAPRGVRRTSRRHGLHSEASHRFERGVDPEGVERVLRHGLARLTEICGGAAVPGEIVAGVEPRARRRVTLRHDRMTSVLGLDIPVERSADILRRLGCGIEVERGADLEVEIPSFRPDMSREEDVIEEVMRVHGVDHLPTTHRPMLLQAGRSRPSVEDRARRAAAAVGLSEALCFGFASPADLAAVGAPKACVRLDNPLAEQRSVMRTSLVPGLLDALGRARRHGVGDVRLFATGRVFLPTDAAEGLPEERTHLAAVVAGMRKHGFESEPLDLLDAKGLAVEIVERVTRAKAEVALLADRTEIPHLHPRGAAGVWIDGRRVAAFGPLHPDVADRFELDLEAFVLVADLADLAEAVVEAPQYQPVPTLPAATRDLALVVDEEVPAGTLEATIREAAGPLCESVELFDLYSGEGISAGKRSLAYHLVFRDPKSATDPENARTLTDEEVDARTAAVIEAVGAAHGATVRGG